ncbi:MAG: hydrogenase maturation peptidase HycI [Candidatus Omnitrophica bacterium]|nr:hydrogenase maturation peptidase HycI [Candidatus Omnitrophota bacterium]
MQNLKTALRHKLSDARKVAVLGVGSELRGDDAAGVAVARDVQEFIKKEGIGSAKVFLGETAPENLTGEIKRFAPTHVVIIDAVDLRQKPGAINIIDIENEACASFSTHRMPFRILKDYLCGFIGCEVIIIGIQPGSLAFNTGLSRKIQGSVKVVAQEIGSALKMVLLV